MADPARLPRSPDAVAGPGPAVTSTRALALALALAMALAACSPRPAASGAGHASAASARATSSSASPVPVPVPVPDTSPPGRVGRLAELSPGVQRFGVDQTAPAGRPAPFAPGARGARGGGGHAVLQVGSATVRLGPDTLGVAARLDDEAVRLRLDHGEMAVDVRSPAHARDFAIETADGFFVPQQPSFVHVEVKDGHSFGAVWRGVLRFEARRWT